MTLDGEMVERYHRDGFLRLPADFLPADAFRQLVAAAPAVLAQDGPGRVLERDGVTVRSVYGPHLSDPAVQRVARSPELVGAMRQILGDDVYLHQSKINLKAAFSGDRWEWHQDYINWLRCDGIRRPDLVNVAVFLDDVTEFNGPLTLIPGSHRQGLLAGTDSEGMPIGYEDAPAWVSTLTADEKFQVDHEVIRRLATENGMVAATGGAGSVLLFHANVLHASVANLSPFDRSVLLLVYNGVGNRPTDVPNPRPAFLADRTAAAL